MNSLSGSCLSTYWIFSMALFLEQGLLLYISNLLHVSCLERYLDCRQTKSFCNTQKGLREALCSFMEVMSENSLRIDFLIPIWGSCAFFQRPGRINVAAGSQTRNRSHCISFLLFPCRSIFAFKDKKWCIFVRRWTPVMDKTKPSWNIYTSFYFSSEYQPNYLLKEYI